MGRYSCTDTDLPEDVYMMRKARVEEWLKHVAGLRRAIDAAEADLNALRDRMSLCGHAMGVKVSNGHIADSSRIPDGLAALEESAARLDALLLEYAHETDEARKAFSMLPRSEITAAFTLHYLVGMPWRKVAHELGYSAEHVKKMRGNAVPLLWPLMPAEWRQMPHAV